MSGTTPDDMLRKLLAVALSTSSDGEALAALGRVRSQLTTRKLSASDISISTNGAARSNGFEFMELVRERLGRQTAESEALRLRIEVRNKDREIARLREEADATRVKPQRTASAHRPGKMAAARALLIRRYGASAAEIAEVTGWDVGRRHINKLAKLAGLRVEELAPRVWRLV